MAALHQLFCVRVVATATAHQVTAVTAGGGFVALPEMTKKEANILNKPSILHYTIFAILNRVKFRMEQAMTANISTLVSCINTEVYSFIYTYHLYSHILQVHNSSLKVLD